MPARRATRTTAVHHDPHQASEQIADGGTDHAADQPEHGRLHQEDSEYVTVTRADGLEDADLPSPFPHRSEKSIGDAERRDEQRNATDCAEHDLDHTEVAAHGCDQVLRRASRARACAGQAAGKS